MVEVVIPEVSYDQKDIERETSEERVREAWGLFAVDDATPKVNEETGRLSINLRVSPVDPEDNTTRLKPNLWYTFHMPLKNPNFPDYVPPTWCRGFALQFLQSAYADEFPKFPGKSRQGWMYKGELIEEDEALKIKEELITAMLDKCAHFYNNPEELRDAAFYAKVKWNGDFTNLDSLSSEPPSNPADEDDMLAAGRVTVLVGGKKKEEPKTVASKRAAKKRR